MIIQRALPEDAESLSDIAFRSKAFWDYDEEFMEQCRDELTLVPAYIESRSVYTLMENDQRIGFYGMSLSQNQATLDFLYVDPRHMRRGYGKMLWNHAISQAKERNVQYIFLDADPHAELFYLAMGAKRIGVSPSGSIPNRLLPLMRYSIEE